MYKCSMLAAVKYLTVSIKYLQYDLTHWEAAFPLSDRFKDVPDNFIKMSDNLQLEQMKAKLVLIKKIHEMDVTKWLNDNLPIVRHCYYTLDEPLVTCQWPICAYTTSTVHPLILHFNRRQSVWCTEVFVSGSLGCKWTIEPLNYIHQIRQIKKIRLSVYKRISTTDV